MVEIAESDDAADTQQGTVPSPRIGGGNDASAWTGGSNLSSKKLGRPNSTMARRPTDFKSANTIEHIATKGLPEDRHIGPDEKTSKITLTSWVNSARSYMEERGLDTVFHVYDWKTNSEVYLLTDWGSASPAKIEAWVATLRAGVTQADGTTLDPCNYDLDNLKWSGKAILNSVSLPLWETVEKDLGVDASGPEAFAAVVYKLQQVSSAAVRALVDELKGLSLLKEPGQDVEIFGGRVVELCRRISGTGSAPADLVVLAAGTFLDCDVLAFKLKAIKVHDEVDEDSRSMSWDTVVRTLKTKYQSLKGQGLWSPQATTKKRDDEMAGLHAAINKLTAQVGGGAGNGGGGGIRCYGCNELGHMSRDCPRNRPSASGSRTPPKDGEAQTKTLEGISHSWCGVCRRWTKGAKEHLTAGHVRRDRGASGALPPAAPAQAPAETPSHTPVLAPAVGGVIDPNPYQGGTLHLQSGLFIGQLKKGGFAPGAESCNEISSDANPSLGEDATICPEDLFHVTPRKPDGTKTPSRFNGSGPKSTLCEGKGSLFIATAHKRASLRDQAKSVRMDEQPTSNMTPFLTHVAQGRKVAGANIESWVTAVESKLAEVGIVTVQETVAMVPRINRLLQKKNLVPLFTRTLALMGKEGVKLISLDDESASANYNSDQMRHFLEGVAIVRGIKGKNIAPWVAKVHSKLLKIGAISVRSTVSGIVTLNQRLFAAGLQVMHQETLEVMAREGANALSVEALDPVDLWYRDLHEVGPGTCRNCEDTGKIGAPCDNCTTGARYRDADLDSWNKLEYGGCQSCDENGETGQECKVCNDGSIHLNFRAGL
jgi:hypothetical protein